VSVIKKNKAALDTQKRSKFRSKMRQNAFDDGLRQDPLGELECSPRPPSRNTGGGMPTSKREGKEWNGKREGRNGKWGREERKGRGGREGEWRTPVPDWESAKVATLATPHYQLFHCSLWHNNY